MLLLRVSVAVVGTLIVSSFAWLGAQTKETRLIGSQQGTGVVQTHGRNTVAIGISGISASGTGISGTGFADT